MLFEIEYFQANDQEDNVGRYLENLKKQYEKLWEIVFQFLRKIRDSQYQSGKFWKNIGGGIIEIRHRAGRVQSRIYCCYNGKQKIMLLNGALKKEKKKQQNDIKRARELKIMLQNENEKNQS
jgi:putative component of toxin-antitoxin plasmid stabilization module